MKFLTGNPGKNPFWQRKEDKTCGQSTDAPVIIRTSPGVDSRLAQRGKMAPKLIKNETDS